MIAFSPISHGAAPDLVTKAILALGNRLPEDLGLLRSLITDEDLVSTLVGDSSVHESLRMLLEGDIPGGLQGLGDNEDLMTAVGNVLAQDEGLMERLEPLGITSAADIAKLGPTISNVFELADAVGSGDIRASIEALATFAAELPSGIREKMIDSVIGGLNLNPGLEALLGGVVDAMTNPEIAEAVGAAFAAFASGDPLEFIRKLGEAGTLISEQSPDLAISFLNALQFVPGPAGEFFSDPILNQGIVESGALGNFFEAVTLVASGDLAGAIGKLGDAIGSLISHGDPATIGPFDPLGMFGPEFGPYELPIGDQALDLIGRLVMQFVEAMPPQVKSFLQEQAGNAVASSGLQSIPVIGPVVGVVDAGVDLVNSISNGDSGLTIALNAADLAINAAGFFPPAQAALAPLRTLLGIAQGVNATVEFIGGISDFGEQFTGI